MNKTLKLNFDKIAKDEFYLKVKKYIDKGYKISKVLKENDLFYEAKLVFVGLEEVENIYCIFKYYGDEMKKSSLEQKEKQGYVVCFDQWDDLADESSICIMVNEKNIYIK
ncbi:MAG: hypothetical protein RSB51_03265 [Clostridia bacterium]